MNLEREFPPDKGNDKEDLRKNKDIEGPLVGGSTAFYFPRKRRVTEPTESLSPDEPQSTPSTPPLEKPEEEEKSPTVLPPKLASKFGKPPFLEKLGKERKELPVIPWEDEGKRDFISRVFDTIHFLENIGLKGKVRDINPFKAFLFFLLSDVIGVNFIYFLTLLVIVLLLFSINIFGFKVPLKEILAAKGLSLVTLLFSLLVGEVLVFIQAFGQMAFIFLLALISWVILSATGEKVSLIKLWSAELYGLGYIALGIIPYFFGFMLPIIILSICPFLSLLLLALRKPLLLGMYIFLLYGFGKVFLNSLRIIGALAESIGVPNSKVSLVTFPYIIIYAIAILVFLLSMVKVLLT